MEHKATNKRKSVADSLTSDLTYYVHIARDKFLKHRPVGCFPSFALINLYYCTKFYKLPIHYCFVLLCLSWVLLLRNTPCCQLKDILFVSLFHCMKVKFVAQTRHWKYRKSLTIAMMRTYGFQLSCLFVLLQNNRVLFWMAAREHRKAVESRFSNRVMFLCLCSRDAVARRKPQLIPFITSLDVNETILAVPLNFLRSTRYLWSWPIDVDNCRGATVNCLLWAAITCLYLSGLQSCLGTWQQCLCACVCVYLFAARLGCWGHCNLVRHQLELAQKKKRERERENNMKSGSAISAFSYCYIKFVPKQEHRGFQQRWQLFGWQSH